MKRFILFVICFVLIFAVGCKETESDSRTADGSLVFTKENLPKIAATPNTVETAQNYASAILGIDKTEAAAVVTVCDTTDECYLKLIDNECDIAIAYEYGSVTEKAFSTTALRFTSTEIKQDALVFLTNGKQKVDSVTSQQLKSLLSGEIVDWADVGGEKMAVVPFGQNVGTAVQNAFEKHIGKNVKISEVVSTVLTKNGEFKAQLAYDNRDGGLGYALFSQCKHTLNNGIVALKIDGVEPTDDNIQAGRYTLKAPVLVSIRISEAANSKTKLLYDWMISEQGLKCVG